MVENIDDAVVLGSNTRLETWDGPADFDPAGWDRSHVLEVLFESGILGFSTGRRPGMKPDRHGA
ncbi:hypothetical protein [Micromonospora sp. CPCC 205558]|uniref:hypothetical protein n=1 Tax=Micromonospora sp. CPCC 205558 TaxID=3122403 RepID=UPI002FEFA18B